MQPLLEILWHWNSVPVLLLCNIQPPSAFMNTGRFPPVVCVLRGRNLLELCGLRAIWQVWMTLSPDWNEFGLCDTWTWQKSIYSFSQLSSTTFSYWRSIEKEFLAVLARIWRQANNSCVIMCASAGKRSGFISLVTDEVRIYRNYISIVLSFGIWCRAVR